MASRSTRIAKNSLILYVQMLLGMFIGLYTSRAILHVLGIEDFGLYNVIGGVVAMFAILNSAMSSSTSRFLTVGISENDKDNLKKIFGTSLLIHFCIGLLVVAIAEPIGIWFMRHEMQIPPQRFEASLWVFHSAVISIFITIISVPYNAVIIAHERMNAFAVISIVDVLLKLLIVLCLSAMPYDKLKTYAVLLVLSQCVVQLLYWGYCRCYFQEVRGGVKVERSLLKKMSSFAGWSLFGDSAVMLMTQGLNILLNIFFGPSVNASRGIAIQVQGVLTRFIGNFQTALNPQLMKSYASKDLDYMHRLIYISSKYSFYIFFILALPIFLETKNILSWWLKTVPDHTVNFIRILLVISLLDCLSNPLVIAAKATGEIKKYQILVGTLLLLIVPISYLALRYGYPPETVFIVHLAVVLLAQFLRVFLIKSMIQLSLRQYVYEVIVRCLLVTILAPIAPYIMYQHVPDSLLRFLLLLLLSVLSVCISVYLFGMGRSEKDMLSTKVKSVYRNLFHARPVNTKNEKN